MGEDFQELAIPNSDIPSRTSITTITTEIARSEKEERPRLGYLSEMQPRQISKLQAAVYLQENRWQGLKKADVTINARTLGQIESRTVFSGCPQQTHQSPPAIFCCLLLVALGKPKCSKRMLLSTQQHFSGSSPPFPALPLTVSPDYSSLRQVTHLDNKFNHLIISCVRSLRSPPTLHLLDDSLAFRIHNISS